MVNFKSLLFGAAVLSTFVQGEPFSSYFTGRRTDLYPMFRDARASAR